MDKLYITWNTRINSKGFWQWYVAMRITQFLDFVHHLLSWKNTFCNLNLFPSSHRWLKKNRPCPVVDISSSQYSQLSASPPSHPRTGNRSNFWNVFIQILDDGQSQETQLSWLKHTYISVWNMASIYKYLIYRYNWKYSYSHVKV